MALAAIGKQYYKKGLSQLNCHKLYRRHKKGTTKVEN